VWESNPIIASQKMQELNHITSDQRQHALPLSHLLKYPSISINQSSQSQPASSTFAIVYEISTVDD
jgi:hypothetical protein